MATTNRAFRVKSGLVVEGSTATVAGSQVLVDADKGANNGVASLDSTGNVPLSQLGNIPGGSGDYTVTDSLAGDTLYVGDVQPTSPAEGDVWIDESSVTGAITWGQLKALEGIASGG